MKFLSENGTILHHSCPGTSHQNGQAKRKTQIKGFLKYSHILTRLFKLEFHRVKYSHKQFIKRTQRHQSKEKHADVDERY